MATDPTLTPAEARRPARPFDTERALRALSRLHGGRPFESEADAEAFLATWRGASVEELRAQAGSDEVEEAQEFAFQAMEAERPGDALALAHRALSLDPDCLDALVVQARSEAGSPSATASRLKELRRRAEALADEGLMRAYRGRLWGVLEARPHLRLRQALAEALERAGRPKEAAAVLEELLEMDEGDRLGARYRLAPLYLHLNRLKPFQALLAAFPEDRSAALAWLAALGAVRAFLAAETEAAESAARLALLRAREANAHFEGFLTGRQRPLKRPEGEAAPGSPEEGALLLHQVGPAWTSSRPALYWLFQQG